MTWVGAVTWEDLDGGLNIACGTGNGIWRAGKKKNFRYFADANCQHQ